MSAEYMRIGIPITNRKPGMTYNEGAKFWVSNVDDYESLQYFQRQLGESGILDALVQKGVQENDTILIGDYQFDYIF